VGGAIAYDLRKFPAEQKDRFVLAVLNGKGAMPAWSGTLTGDQLDALWAYVLTRGK
jgi:mono/diheme cytochrome c family protein